MYSSKAPDSLFPQTMLCMATQISSLGHTDKGRKNWTQILFKLVTMGASWRMSSLNLSVISMLFQSVLKTEESSGDILAVLIFQFHLTFAHR